MSLHWAGSVRLCSDEMMSVVCPSLWNRLKLLPQFAQKGDVHLSLVILIQCLDLVVSSCYCGVVLEVSWDFSLSSLAWNLFQNVDVHCLCCYCRYAENLCELVIGLKLLHPH